MKVLILPILVAAASAQVIPTAFNGIYPGMVSPYVAGQQILSHPVVYQAKPLATMEYEKMAEKPMEKKMEEDKMEVKTYAAFPNVYGQQVVYKQPILKQKLGVPARFHIKNGALEHTSFTKREAEPVFPFVNTYAHAQNVLPFNTYAQNILPYTTGYTGLPVAQVAPAVVPSVYTVPKTVEVQAPAVVKTEMEYLKPKVEEQAKTVANDAVTPFMYAGKFTYKAENAGAVHVAKRSAEPFHPLAYTNTFGVPAVSTYGVPAVSAYGMPAVSTYGVPAVSTYGAINPIQYVSPLKVKTFADDRSKVENYAAKNQYHAENAGAVHIAKRSADPLTILPGYTQPIVHSSINPFFNTYSNAYTNTYANVFPQRVFNYGF